MNNPYEVERDEYSISTDSSRLNLEIIHHYLSEESYWAKNIPFETVKKSVENSLCFGLYHHNKHSLPVARQVGFARLITDKATFAYLADVFILEEYRGKGLSKFLMATIHAHPELQTLRRWMLGTRDAHGLYAQFGWVPFAEEQMKRFMLLHNPDVYKQ